MGVIECVPNISEGRRHDFLDQLAAELRAVPALALLNYSGDRSHHRSVFTFAGQEASVRRAIMTIAARAIGSIDLRTHRGEHPRIGALDVVPFIPLGDTPMADCVVLARDVGRALADQFGLPVYLYEEASVVPGRSRLEQIRRGQFAGLSEKMSDPFWKPDFGPATPHPTAGAAVVGARRPLIAFNVNLATDRVEVARRVARAVRESSGGLPCVKALGLFLADRNIAQVSMNLTNFERPPIASAFERVRDEAAQEDVLVLESELIGLIPEAALTATTPEQLRLRAFSDRQILEVQLRNQGIRV